MYFASAGGGEEEIVLVLVFRNELYSKCLIVLLFSPLQSIR